MVGVMILALTVWEAVYGWNSPAWENYVVIMPTFRWGFQPDLLFQFRFIFLQKLGSYRFFYGDS